MIFYIMNKKRKKYKIQDNMSIKLLEKIYDDIEIPSSKIVEWIFLGIGIHNKGDKCKFGGVVS